MPIWLVTWEVDIEADTAKEAAAEARVIQLDKDSQAVVFICRRDGQKKEVVDLLNEGI